MRPHAGLISDRFYTREYYMQAWKSQNKTVFVKEECQIFSNINILSTVWNFF